MFGTFQFRIRDLVLVFALIASLCAWWMDHNKLKAKLNFYIAVLGANTERLFPAVRLESAAARTMSLRELERLGFWSNFIADNPSDDEIETEGTENEPGSFLEDPFDF